MYALKVIMSNIFDLELIFLRTCTIVHMCVLTMGRSHFFRPGKHMYISNLPPVFVNSTLFRDFLITLYRFPKHNVIESKNVHTQVGTY